MLKKDVITARMLELKMTQGDLAEKLGVTRASISAWLNHKGAEPMLRNVTLLGQALGFQKYDEFVDMATPTERPARRGWRWSKNQPAEEVKIPYAWIDDADVPQETKIPT